MFSLDSTTFWAAQTLLQELEEAGDFRGWEAIKGSTPGTAQLTAWHLRHALLYISEKKKRPSSDKKDCFVHQKGNLCIARCGQKRGVVKLHLLKCWWDLRCDFEMGLFVTWWDRHRSDLAWKTWLHCCHQHESTRVNEGNSTQSRWDCHGLGTLQSLTAGLCCVVGYIVEIESF